MQKVYIYLSSFIHDEGFLYYMQIEKWYICKHNIHIKVANFLFFYWIKGYYDDTNFHNILNK